MKLETFFKKFDLLADAPDAVVKMREIVLTLAVQGKLVPQDPKDEPASLLVERIQEHFAILRSQKELRGSAVETQASETLPSIPSSWKWVSLGNVVGYGSSDKAESSKIPKDAWLLDLQDIEKDTSRLLQRKSFKESPSKSTKTSFQVGDVLYGKLRPYLNKVLIADQPGYCTTEIIPIRTYGFIDPSYLCYALRSPAFIAYAVSKSYGMNLPRLGTEDARKAPFPLAPLAEQKRIVAKVDEMMALCDQLEREQNERDTRHAALARASLARFTTTPTPANLKFLFHKSLDIDPENLRKTILTIAVHGKLVPQDINEGSASDSLDTARLAKNLPPRSLKENDTKSNYFELPKSWIWVKVSDAAESRLGKMLDKAKNRGKPYPYLRNKNVHWFSFELEDIKTMLFERSELPEYTLESGDVLICEGGHGIARTAVWENQIPGITFQKALHRVRPFSCLNGVFLAFCIRHYESEGILQRYYTGAGIPHFTGKALAQVYIPLPPIAEQRRIVAKVDQLMALVDELETQLTRSRTQAAKLLEAVVAELTAA